MPQQLRDDNCRYRPIMTVVMVLTLMAAVFPTAIVSKVSAVELVSGAALRGKLQSEIGISYSGKPLRDALYDLSRKYGVAILLDRRVDPGRPVRFQATAPLLSVIEKLAESAGLQAALLDSVVYVGPAHTVQLLRTVAAAVRENKNLSDAARRKLLARKSIRWDEFAEPRVILADLARSSEIRWYGLGESVPHDLWPAADWPAMTLADRLTLLLGQFGLMFEMSPEGDAIRPIPIPADFGLVRDYPTGADPSGKLRRFAKLAPDARIKCVGDRIYVKALLADHDRLSGRRPSTADGPSTTDNGTAGTTVKPLNLTRIERLKVDNVPLRGILEHLAKNLGAELRVDWAGLARAGIREDQLTSIHVSGITADQLFAEIVKDLPVTVKVEGSVVEIVPK